MDAGWCIYQIYQLWSREDRKDPRMSKTLQLTHETRLVCDGWQSWRCIHITEWEWSER